MPDHGGRRAPLTDPMNAGSAAGQLINPSSGKCLDATGPSSADGTPLQIWTCGGGANQQWVLPS